MYGANSRQVRGPYLAATCKLPVARAEEDVVAGLLEVAQAVQDPVVFNPVGGAPLWQLIGPTVQQLA
jgi:hypothetical protein